MDGPVRRVEGQARVTGPGRTDAGVHALGQVDQADALGDTADDADIPDRAANGLTALGQEHDFVFVAD